MLFVSCVPFAISHLYKREFLAIHEVDVFRFNYIKGSFQFFFGLLLSPLFVRLQYVNVEPRYGGGLNIGRLFENLIGGFKCLGGINTEEDDACEGNQATVLSCAVIYVVATFGTQFFFVQVRVCAVSRVLFTL